MLKVTALKQSVMEKIDAYVKEHGLKSFGWVPREKEGNIHDVKIRTDMFPHGVSIMQLGSAYCFPIPDDEE